MQSTGTNTSHIYSNIPETFKFFERRENSVSQIFFESDQ